jgi:multicomponent Na+:H+ antiporter subunit G
MAMLALGSAFMLIAAFGIVRLPDLFTRMQAATKASTLGIVCMALSAVAHFGLARVGVQAVLIILFMFLTAPVAAHVLSRAAYRTGVPLWERSVRDELRRDVRMG